MEHGDGRVPDEFPLSHRRRYDERTQVTRDAFEAHLRQTDAGTIAVRARAEIIDELILGLWRDLLHGDPGLCAGVAVIAVGGYGRRELFPFSDIDLMFLLDARIAERVVKEPIRRLNQLLWDCGLRVSAMTRSLSECDRFDPENVEFTLSLLDARYLAGDSELANRLIAKSIPRLIAHERRKIIPRLLEVTRGRHTKYGGTLFHLEPNIKECPGGLRDAHVCEWLMRLDESHIADPTIAFTHAREFVTLVRTFLHSRHGRDDNTLDWQTQDEAASALLGSAGPNLDAAYWMRLYFRHARSIERGVAQAMEEAIPARPAARRPLLAVLRGAASESPATGFEVRQNRIFFSSGTQSDQAHDPDVALGIFGTMARTGASLSREAESRIEQALPNLSAQLEDGPGLWRQLQIILTGQFAGKALRAMHALGILELLIPEFHGIDALVIRDAYHRYTVDEHTFVLIDTLHALRMPAYQKSGKTQPSPDLKSSNFSVLLRELPHPPLLFLAALLHDTGKGHAASGHALESARMAHSVVQRLELDSYEAALVLDIIRNHLEMSAALRRDVFDSETIRAFAARVQTPEALRMLTLFTYADISAVHPDALTPWKAENLWNLHIATANFLDRNVDDERVVSAESQLQEIVQNIEARHPRRLSLDLHHEIVHFLEGFPKRYLQTRTADSIRSHVEMAARIPALENGAFPPAFDPIQLDFRFEVPASELTLVTRDRPMLFALMAGVLAAWGMNIVTADAFSNAHGVVVDSFRFTDTFRTLELNDSERLRFVQSVHDVMSGQVSVEILLESRRRGRRKAPKVKVDARIDFDQQASSHSTLMQVVAQDNPGLLRALSVQISQAQCNIEVALIDTEGEMAIDVFYLTREGRKLEKLEIDGLRVSLHKAIDANAR